MRLVSGIELGRAAGEGSAVQRVGRPNSLIHYESLCVGAVGGEGIHLIAEQID